MNREEFDRKEALYATQLREAQTAHSYRALDFEDGRCELSEVTAANDAVRDIETRLNALRTAWARARAEAEKSNAAETAQRKREAVQAIEGKLAKRAKAAAAMDKAATALAEAVQEYDELTGGIIQDGRPLFSGSDLKLFIDQVQPSARRDYLLISAQLVRAGMVLNPGDTFPGGMGADTIAENEEVLARKIRNALPEVEG